MSFTLFSINDLQGSLAIFNWAYGPFYRKFLKNRLFRRTQLALKKKKNEQLFGYLVNGPIKQVVTRHYNISPYKANVQTVCSKESVSTVRIILGLFSIQCYLYIHICAGREKTESTGDLESQRLVLQSLIFFVNTFFMTTCFLCF